jgi:hypothetical protein
VVAPDGIPMRRSSDDPSSCASFLGIGRQRFVRDEVQIAFNRQPEWPFQCRDLGKADVAQFRATQADVAKAEQPIWIVGIDLADEPCRGGVRREQLEDRLVINAAVERVDEQLMMRSPR